MKTTTTFSGGLFLLFISTAAAGCSSSERGKSAAQAPAPVIAQAPAKEARVPSFSREIAPRLAMRCASDKGCHGANPSLNIDLDLRAEAAYEQLVDHASEERFGAKRVKPGDPDGSYLVAKLSGALHDHEGKAMPLDPQTGAPPPRVPDDPEFLDGALRPWIRAGAPRN